MVSLLLSMKLDLILEDDSMETALVHVHIYCILLFLLITLNNVMNLRLIAHCQYFFSNQHFNIHFWLIACLLRDVNIVYMPILKLKA